MTTLTIDVRRAESDDALAISERRSYTWWQKAIRGSTSILVLEVDKVIAGYATLGLNRARSLPQEGEIYELYLKPEYQGIGLGSQLFGEARRLLRSLGCKGMVVWTLEENERAVNFYIALGGVDLAEGSEIFDERPLKKLAFVWP